MKDKQARALAIVALVFMGIFIVALIITLVDRTILHGSIGYVALCAGVFALMIFIALKADGRGYSITKMNNEIEMEKIEKALEEQAEREKAESEAQADMQDEPSSPDGAADDDAASADAEGESYAESDGE